MLDIAFLGTESQRMRADRRHLPLCCAAASRARSGRFRTGAMAYPFFSRDDPAGPCRPDQNASRLLYPPSPPAYAATVSGRAFANGRNIVAIRNAPTPIANDPRYSQP